ncbi:MAG: AI-2E family transporter, partial [Clostridia bacterium]|nr:AI-2E family transporter [Clostridia bacterium]
KILGNTTGLHPLTVIFALLLGAHWWGVPGILLSVPVVACVKIILQYLFSKIVEITPT